MSLIVQEILNNAQELASKLKNYDEFTDDLLESTSKIIRSSENIQEYHEGINELNEVSGNKMRNQIIMSIQRENAKIKQLEAENDELKAVVSDCRLALELIMLKYRTHTNNFIKLSQAFRKDGIKCEHICNGNSLTPDQSLKIIKDQHEKIGELVAIIQKSLKVDDEENGRIVQRLKQLTEENKGLREMLRISEDIAGPTFGPNIVRPTVEVGVQTEETEKIECSDVRTEKEISSTIKLNKIDLTDNSTKKALDLTRKMKSFDITAIANSNNTESTAPSKVSIDNKSKSNDNCIDNQKMNTSE